MTIDAIAALYTLTHRMLKKDSRVLVAVSGGMDSVALLHIMRNLRGLVGALHFNHRLRGEESQRDEDFVRKLCNEWGIPLSVESADVAKAAEMSGESIEMAARRLRYDFFEREGVRQGAKVATAHTASDNAETILMNLIRGTALRGLSGIPPVRGRFIRPLLSCTREGVEDYCDAHGLDWVEDSTNRSDDHTRNRIRHHVLPLLEDENPWLIHGLTRLSYTLRDDANYLDEKAAQLRKHISRPDGSFEREGLLREHFAIQNRVLIELLHEAGVRPEHKRILDMGIAVNSGKGSIQLSRQVIFECGADAFRLKQVDLPVTPEQFSHDVNLRDLKAVPVEVEVFPGKRVVFSLQNWGVEKKMPKIQKKDLNYYLDYDRIENVVNLRSRLPGDKLRQPGRNCTKTLKNLFQEMGTGQAERAGVALLTDENGVLWAEGIGPDERVAVTEKTDRTVKITVEIEGSVWSNKSQRF